MPHPKHGYRLRDGTPVPSVTTIIGRFKDSGGLIRWANRMGLEGKDSREVVAEAATAGTICHGMIECRILGKRLPKYEDVDPSILSKARQGFEGFLAWRRSTGVEVETTELGLVSETMRFGGTMDAGGRGLVGGRQAMIDWKCSGRIYADYLVQLGGYTCLWDEAFPDKPILEFHLLRVGKKFGEFEHRFWPTEVVALAKRQFLVFREAYDLDLELKSAV